MRGYTRLRVRRARSLGNETRASPATTCYNKRSPGPAWPSGHTVAVMPRRFLTRKQVAEELNISMAQCYALIRRGELRAAKIGGRGDYRIGRDDLEAYIERTYAETERWIEEHSFTEEATSSAES